jgi:hypothetical protein
MVWYLKILDFDFSMDHSQDLPSVEIPLVECSPPPVKRDNIKYATGEPTTTYINLLDWDEANGPSPLATSKGWVDVNTNEFVAVNPEFDGVFPVTTNGLPMTEDFDLAVYIKGDKKPTIIYRAWLEIDYDDEDPNTTPTPSPTVGPTTLCTKDDFFTECTTTGGCKKMYGPSAYDCTNSGGGYCLCGDKSTGGDVCGCVIPAPTPAPSSTCDVDSFLKECKTTKFCKSKYPTAYDCKNSEGGICYCGAGDPGEICGCLE